MNRAELKNLSKSQLKGHWKVPVLLTLTYFIIIFAISMAQNNLQSGISIVIGLLVSLAFEGWAFVGFPNFYLNFIEKSGEAVYKDFLVSKGALLKSLGYMILMSLIGGLIGVIIGIAIVSSITSSMLGYTGFSLASWSMILLIIVLSVLLTVFSLAIAMTGYILVDKEGTKVFQAIGLSMRMMKGYKWEFFVLYISFIGWGILSLLTLGIGFIWLTPYMTLTFTNFYKEIDKKYNVIEDLSQY